MLISEPQALQSRVVYNSISTFNMKAIYILIAVLLSLQGLETDFVTFQPIPEDAFEASLQYFSSALDWHSPVRQATDGI